MTALDQAFKYAEELGFRVFPIVKGGKRPAIKSAHPEGDPLRGKCHGDCGKDGHGLHDATTDPAKIQKWASEYPGCNWAVATGWESGVLIIDIDSTDASGWWDDNWTTASVEVTTPRGGRHIYYAYSDDDRDVSISSNDIYQGIDLRANGGYALLPGSSTSSKVDRAYADGEYVGEIKDMSPVDESVMALIPEKREIDRYRPEMQQVESGKPSEPSEGEKRVLASIVGNLDALPVPWVPNAGYHHVQFGAACHLRRIINSPDYALTEDQAFELFMEHAPVRKDAAEDFRTKRWNEAIKVVGDDMAEPPGDVPVRLDYDALLGKYASTKIDRLFWESKTTGEIKDLIRELRHKGANIQEAYSISYECRAARKRRERPGSEAFTTWSYCLKDFGPEDSEEDHAADEDWGDDNSTAEQIEKVEVKEKPDLLTKEERDLIRDYPNFVDRYIDIVKEMTPEPNIPLHYANAWLALSAIAADKGTIYLEGETRPLNFWGLSAASSGSGKGFAKWMYRSTVNAGRFGGFKDIDLGPDASAEALNANVMERDGEVCIFNTDEAAAILMAFKDPRSHSKKLHDLALNLYDGEATQALRSGMNREDAGRTVTVAFNMWLQTTWKNVIEIMNEKDVETGFVGRFIFAIGEDIRVTKDSLRLRMASEETVEDGGKDPRIEILGRSVRDRLTARTMKSPMKMSPEIGDRFLQLGLDIIEHVSSFTSQEGIESIAMRIRLNILKGAALHALSEGRGTVELTDLLIAMKSGEYWVRDAIRVIKAISETEYRRNIDALVAFVWSSPKTKRQIIGKTGPFKNLKTYEIDEFIDRAGEEGQIEKVPGSEKWRAVR